MTTMTETTTKATELAAMFETRKRDNGEEFVSLTDNVPDWASEFVMEAHGTDFLPDDYRYRWIAEALELIAQEGEDEDLASRFADDVDVYTSSLLAWLASNLQRTGYCDEAVSEGMTDGRDIVKTIMAGQASERYEVFTNVVAALEDLETE